ncbi:hypothetical protein [Azospirillum sp. ST 5-10]|uniref:hypothetical protein n=1 Tax=unclassified Azospirillum TaxID=2630922 RepID=UPI003F49EEED
MKKCAGRTDPEFPMYFDSKIEALAAYFREWQGHKIKSDDLLYRALGNVYRFSKQLSNQREQFIAYAKSKSVPANRRSTIFLVCTKIIFRTDRQAASKYAGVMAFAEANGVPGDTELFTQFVKSRGGIEACLASWRAQNKGTKIQHSRPNPNGSTLVKKINRLPLVETIEDVKDVDGHVDAFMLIAIRNEKGSFSLVSTPIHDDKMLKRAAERICSGR